MALVSSVHVLPLDSNRLLDYRAGNRMENNGEIHEEPRPAPALENIYVLVGKDKKDNKNTLSYTVQNFPGRKIVIVHVHQPAQEIPTPLGKFHASKLKDREVKLYRETEEKDMMKIMEELMIFLTLHERVQTDKLIRIADDIQVEIVKLVAEHGITKLVMGAAADKHYSKRMRSPKSKKAIFVGQQASPSCQISFVCKGHHVCTREEYEGGIVWWIPGQVLQHSISMPAVRSPGVFDRIRNRSRSCNPTTSTLLSPSPNPTPRGSVRDLESSSRSSVNDSTSTCSPPNPSSVSGCRTGEEERGTALGMMARDHHKDDDDEDEGANANANVITSLSSVSESEEDHRIDNNEDTREVEDLLAQIEFARIEATNSKTAAFEESLKRKKAEEYAQDAIRKAKAYENAYAKAVKQRKNGEEMLAQKKEENENLKTQIKEVAEQLQKASEQNLVLELRVSDSDRLLMEAEAKLRAAEEFFIRMQAERDELQRQRDEAMAEIEELHQQRQAEIAAAVAAAHNSGGRMNFAEFSYSELEDATNNFEETLKIGEGGYGSVYRGLIRHTEVAIKMLHPQSMQGQAEFQQELDVLSRMRHPNLVTLMGTCLEASSLVYEYLPNGSLEDRLICKNNSPPLSWQTRTRIAAEICSALLFLHSAKPDGVVHGDLKPANIILDQHLVSKLGDFGICRLIPQGSSGTTLCRNTDPKGTFAYMDPEFLSTGNLTPKSDVYSFGVIILQMLTGKPALGIVTEVREALGKERLQEVLDGLAGDWPFVQARQLAYLGLKCCKLRRRERPDLGSEVWRVLQPMLASASSFRLEEDSNRTPPYFICPIFQEIMSDPQIAADGYTYEAEALRGWLDSSHDTSPMTNLKLQHKNLIPNHALRSAIQEWLQRQ